MRLPELVIGSLNEAAEAADEAPRLWMRLDSWQSMHNRPDWPDRGGG
jgi:hypothetical protein